MPKTDSVLAHCVARAVIAAQGGLSGAVEAYGANAERLSKWEGLRVGAKVTPKASRVAAFIVMWAIAMRAEGSEDYSITEYLRYWSEGERQAYRLQREFRELWPEYETPNQLASQIVKYVDRRTSKRSVASLPLKLQVTV